MPKQTKENKRPFVVAYTDAIEAAAQNIHKPSTFKLYLYCICNRDNYHFALSPQDFATRYGISLDSAKDAVKDLIALGYLVLREKKTYDFYETPCAIEIEPVEVIRKKFKFKNGDVLDMTLSELTERIGNQEKAEEIWRNAQ